MSTKSVFSLLRSEAVSERFRILASKTSNVVGSPWHFILWVFLTLIWLASGFFTGFNETWNFWANTSTTILTFLIALLLQNSQNRSSKEIQLKLDEIIRAIEEADNDFIDLERLSEKELRKLESQLKEIRNKR